MSIVENIKKGQIWNEPLTPLMLQFEEETGYKAVLVNGKITGHFEHWLWYHNKPHGNIGRIRTDEHKKNYSESKKGEKNPMYGKISANRGKFGKDSSAYKENIGYSAIHKRAGKVDPKPKDGICKLCGNVADKNGKTKLIHSNKDHTYNLPIVPDEWHWIHESCHGQYDKEKGIRKHRKRTKNLYQKIDK